MLVKIKYYQVTQIDPQLRLLNGILHQGDVIEVEYCQGCSTARYSLADKGGQHYDKDKLNVFFNSFYRIEESGSIKEVAKKDIEFHIDDLVILKGKPSVKYRVVELRLWSYDNVRIKSDNDKTSKLVNSNELLKLTPFYFVNSDGVVCVDYKELHPRKYAVTKTIGNGFDSKVEADAYKSSIAYKVEVLEQSTRRDFKMS